MPGAAVLSTLKSKHVVDQTQQNETVPLDGQENWFGLLGQGAIGILPQLPDKTED
ncbi:hypothetical protein SDC9_112258 [bioreactor metagenome]|uniref:Uncharacterized protein n=1 Tax=bioreactor metagenome TaxID=1076179 RepID=A0A645BQ63_9ZZZZ